MFTRLGTGRQDGRGRRIHWAMASTLHQFVWWKIEKAQAHYVAKTMRQHVSVTFSWVSNIFYFIDHSHLRVKLTRRPSYRYSQFNCFIIEAFVKVNSTVAVGQLAEQSLLMSGVCSSKPVNGKKISWTYLLLIEQLWRNCLCFKLLIIVVLIRVL